VKRGHNALIHIATDLVGGVSRCERAFAKLKTQAHLEAVSSVYKRYLSSDRVDMKAQMELVCRLQTELEAGALLQFVESLDEKIMINLLVFDDLILMSPRLTLPYPELHIDGLIIRCAAEAWGSYEHPIYEKTLSEISRTAQPVHEAEFFLQGRNLIDIE
jgi:7,8-dihydro-6-hydroxymethylpterin-pyrophosphokinase